MVLRGGPPPGRPAALGSAPEPSPAPASGSDAMLAKRRDDGMALLERGLRI